MKEPNKTVGINVYEKKNLTEQEILEKYIKFELDQQQKFEEWFNKICKEEMEGG